MSRRLLGLALAAWCAVQGSAAALELKNVRPCYGPQGATRTNVKCQPGDVLFITYDIEGLAVDEKSGKANFLTTLEFLDSNGKVQFKKETPNEVIPQLGGTRMPGDLHIIVPPKIEAGKYAVKLTVNDRLGKEIKSFTYAFEITGETFGMVGVTAQSVGFPGQYYVAGFALVNMSLTKVKEAKNQALPNVEVVMKVLDENGKAVAKPIYTFLPKDLPDDADLSKSNFLPMQFPIYLNRTGRFQVDVVATDKTANRTVTLRYPLTVLDLTALGGK